MQLAQPMPGHEVTAVDYETRVSMTPVSSRAVVAVVSVIAVALGLIIGLRWAFDADDAHGADSDLLAAVPRESSAASPSGSAEKHGVGSGKDTESARRAEGEASGRDSETSQSAADQSVVISIQGLVKAPGLLRVTAETRIGEAITLAGGPVPPANITNINLAQLVSDGTQVVVDEHGSSLAGPGPVDSAPGGASAAGRQSPSNGAVGGAMGSERAGNGPTGKNLAGGGPASSKPGTVNLNSATPAELETIRGIGPATAEAIISYRESHGPFTSVEQLQEVRGIGPAKFEAMKDAVTV